MMADRYNPNVRPEGVPELEWELITSPENYYMDGEVSREQADAVFQQRAAALVARHAPRD